MKRFLWRLMSLALVIAALGVALLPVIVRQYRLWRDALAVTAYRDAIDALDDVDCGALNSAALQYDGTLGDVALTDPFAPRGESGADDVYWTLMDPAGTGVLAVLELPKLGATLPVYHGAARAASGRGVGHLEESGLPVDGASAACVLAARGNGWIPGPFAGLDRLLPGDLFTVRSLRDALTFEVTRVSPTPDGALGQDGEGQSCVLMTTTGRGGQGERLYVLGTRVQRRDVTPRDDSQALAPWPSRLLFAAPVAAVGLILIWMVEGVRRFARRRRAKRVRL